MSATLESVEIWVIPDEDGDASYLEQEVFADRLAEYQRGAFAFVGVRVVAKIAIPSGEGGHYSQTIETPGLWSIEDDSGEDYYRETASDEADTLRTMLAELGVSGDFDIATAPLKYR